MTERIAAGLESLGLADRVPAEAAGQLAAYGTLLLEKNRVMDLTAITDPAQVAGLHMLDCAALLNYADFKGSSLIDVGSGAGFPGLVLKILVPSLEVTLLDSLNKRLDWLEDVAALLGLTGVRTVHGRAEELAHDPAFRQRSDFATARAVAELRLLAELCLPFVRPGGQFLAMKSVGSGDEIAAAVRAIETLGGGQARCFDYDIPGAGVAHRVVAVPKTGDTPAGYPRRWARMQSKPL